MHEIAHNLGMVHGSDECSTNLYIGTTTYDSGLGILLLDVNSSQSAVHVPGTPHGDSDDESVFNYFSCSDPICEFSEGDLVALDYLYPSDGCKCVCLCDLWDDSEGSGNFPAVEVDCYRDIEGCSDCYFVNRY